MTNEYVLATNDDGELAVRTVNATESSSVTSTNDIITRTEDGKLAVRVVGAGGGDTHNKGYFADQAALEEAYPTGEAGDYAVVGDTDTIWIWDTDNSAWVDSDTKGQVTSVNNQTGAVTIGANDILPSQTGNSGKFLTTDGTDASWSDKPLQNAFTSGSGLWIQKAGTTNSINNDSVSICSTYSANYTSYSHVAIAAGFYNGAKPGMWSLSIGGKATGGEAIAIKGTASGSRSITIGSANTVASGSHSIAIGDGRSYANGAIMIAADPNNVPENYDANTFKVANQNGNYEIMSADGTIPTDRFTTTPSADGTYYPTLSISSGTATRSWGTINALENKATGTESLGILSSTFSYTYSTVCGSIAYASGNNATVVGYNSVGNTDAVAVGYQADTKQGCVSIGKWAGEHSNCGARSVYIGQSATGSSSATDGIAIGYWVQAKAKHAIQLGSVSSSAATTNSDANTFKVANANGNFEIMSADGTIPTGRLADTTNAAQGQVLTLDSNLNAVWQAGGGGGLPTQTGNAGKFLTTDGTDASWSDKPLVNSATATGALTILGDAATGILAVNIGGNSEATGARGVAVGFGSSVRGSYSVGIGPTAKVTANYAIQIAAVDASVTNSDANTFKVANANGNFELMNANGNLPADRLASTTGLADGNYRLRLTMASGVATLSWVAE